MSEPKPEPDRTIRTDPDINAYQGYLPDEWDARVLNPITAGTVLERLLIDFALAWRSASYTAQMPVTSIRAMHAAAVGRANFASKNASIVDFAERAIGQLADRVPALHANRALGNKMVRELRDIATGFRDRARKAKVEISLEPVWDQFMQDVAFRLFLWSSQRVSYVAFYNAYEAFLVDALKVGSGAASLRVTMKKEFNEALRTALGADISVPCWLHNEVLVPRLVRHALSHNGGRVTSDLRAQKHGIELIGEELQILPTDIHRMLARLRSAAERVVEVAKGDTRFLAPAAKLPHPRDED